MVGQGYCTPHGAVTDEHSIGGMILTGKTEELGETCPCANFSTTDPTWTDTEANPALAVRSQGLTACAMARSIRDSYQD
jgi:hypothetical protein